MSGALLIYAAYCATVVLVGTLAYLVYTAFSNDIREKDDDW
jgi:hypothetical protein